MTPEQKALHEEATAYLAACRGVFLTALVVDCPGGVLFLQRSLTGSLFLHHAEDTGLVTALVPGDERVLVLEPHDYYSMTMYILDHHPLSLFGSAE